MSQEQVRADCTPASVSVSLAKCASLSRPADQPAWRAEWRAAARYVSRETLVGVSGGGTMVFREGEGGGRRTEGSLEDSLGTGECRAQY